MYSDVRKSRAWIVWLILVLVVIFFLVAVFIRDPGRDISEESAAAIQEAVERSARQCYVVEGVYPPNLAYLEENYGLQINQEDFYVTYDAFASNLPPNVVVTSRKG